MPQSTPSPADDLTKAFSLGGLVWQQSDDVLSYRSPWWMYWLGAFFSLVVLGIEARYVVSLVEDPPSLTVGASRFGRGAEIAWKDQTWGQRGETLGIRVGMFVFVPSIISLGFLFFGSEEQRNQTRFIKSADEMCKGKKQLGKLSNIKSVAIVHWARGIGRGTTGPATQVFIRFGRAPWSILVDSSAGANSADRVANTLAGWLGVPLVFEPMSIRPERRGGRGFPVVFPEKLPDPPTEDAGKQG